MLFRTFAVYIELGTQESMTLIEKVKNWYRGKYIPPLPNDPDSPVVFFSIGRYEQPLLAKILGAVGKFWIDHWQWIIGTFLAIVAICVAA